MQDILENEVVNETTNETTAPANISETLQGVFWGDTPPSNQQQQVEQKQDVVEEKKEEQNVEQPQVNEWWKEFEFQDADTAKNEIKRLKEQKPQEEIKFANEDSKKFFDYWKEGKIDDAHEMWAKNKKVEKLISGEVTEANAADILKASLKNKYKEFSDADVDRKFNKQYAIPKEPVYDELKETEDEFAIRKVEWKERVDEIKADILLDAKIAKPELEKLKSELVLPDISQGKNEVSKEPTQEELEAFKKQQAGFVESTEKFLNSFNGFSATVKDKDVDYTVSYGTSKEEKDLALTMMKEFAETGFNANNLFVKEWVNQDGTLNVNKIIEDKMFLLNKDKVIQKIANDAANQRLELYLKEKKNIRIDNTGGKDFGAGEDQKSQSQKLQEVFWGS